MICKFCTKEIENDSIFCRFCGERVQRAKRKPKDEISVPAPELTKQGRYRGRLMVNGQRIYVTEDTEAAYYVRARAIKQGLIEQARTMPSMTLGQMIDKYINDNEAVLSPSTIKGYQSMRKNRFEAYMDADVRSVPFQVMISEESIKVNAKTVANAWRLLTAAMRYAKYPVSDVKLPKSVHTERAFLDFKQIQTFLRAIQGDPCELAYLLALHSLRLSEILALQEGSCAGGVIRVRGALVRGPHGHVRTELNKTDLSRRDVPIMIPRLTELIGSLPVKMSGKMMNSHLHGIGEANGLPEITLHCLRHSFASLAYHLKWTEKSTMQIGGWSTPEVVHRIYTHLAQQDVSEDVRRMKEFYKEKP